MRAKITKISRGRQGIARQQGVAVVTALLLTTLAITIVTSLFWQQHVQVRSIENQQLQLQTQWILRGTLDWARLILGEDANNSSVDHLGEVWAVPLAATELGGHLDKKDGSLTEAVVSGSIVDAQSRFNLRNLAPTNTVDLAEVAAFQRMLTALRIDPRLARRTADWMASTHIEPAADADTPKKKGEKKGARALGVQVLEDLFAVPGMTPEILDKLKDFVVVLPNPTPINVNTVSPQVLAAKVEGLSLEEATALVAGRDRAYIRDEGDLNLRLHGKFEEALNGKVSVSTNFFLVSANVRLNKSTLKIQALMARNIMTGSKLIWLREY